MSRTLVIAAAALAMLGACSANQSDSQAGATPPGAQAQAGATNAGKVLQTVNGGGYTYAEVEVAGGAKVWVAGSQIEIKPGAQISWGNAMVMQNFTSKTLNRTFEQVLFVESWGKPGAMQVATAPHGQLPTAQLPGAGNPAAAAPTGKGVVKSVTTGGGYSYVEIDTNGAVVWVAAMETPLKRGDKVEWSGTEMANFTAKSINRTFPKIVFAQGLAVVK
jgi:hypothetical protein